MAIRFHTLMTVSMAAFLTAGCSMLSFGRDEPQARAPEPVAPLPSGSVTGSALPPPGAIDPMVQPPGSIAPTAGVATTPGAVPTDPAMQTASTMPAAGAGALGRTDVLGGWTISSAGDSCQLFMTLTTWAGGYRASTRGCANAALQTISAWNMDGAQVQLFNDAGTTIARLYPASKTLFNGQTEGGGPVTVSR